MVQGGEGIPQTLFGTYCKVLAGGSDYGNNY